MQPLFQATSFPLSKVAINAFSELKQSLVQEAFQNIEEDAPFNIETDASDVAVSATFNPKNRPVAFYSRV